MDTAARKHTGTQATAAPPARHAGIRGLVAAASLLLSACATTHGANTVVPSGYNYNSAIAQTLDQQLLLNLVRLRYRDTVVFMEISSVTTQHNYSAGLASENALPFRNFGDGASLVIPSTSYSERPTVSYVPVTGTEFAANLLSPISAETIVLLANSGWSIERLMSCCVERLGDLSNAPSASGPTPPRLPDNQRFRELAKLLRKFQLQENVYVEHLPPSNGGAPKSHLSVDVPNGADCDALKQLLPATSCNAKFDLVARGAPQDGRTVLAQTRTVLGAMYALSHAVEVPQAHSNAGFVTTSDVAETGTQNWHEFLSHQFKVQSAASQPATAFVKIRYRDHWFWIDDSDLESKTTFSLLRFLLSLQSAASDGKTPLLTLGAG